MNRVRIVKNRDFHGKHLDRMIKKEDKWRKDWAWNCEGLKHREYSDYRGCP